MAIWHQESLRNALEARGWRIVAEHPGDGYGISGSWEIQRSTHKPPLFINFDGLDDLHCLPMPRSYGCHVREQPVSGLYFRKQRSRALWTAELRAFIAALDDIDATR